MGKKRTGRDGRRDRRGAVVVLVAVSSTVIIGFAALTIDVGNMYIVRGELQRSADAAALAAASRLASYVPGVSEAEAVEQAGRIVESNPVQTRRMQLDAGRDVEFGQATLNQTRTRHVFEPSVEGVPTAVRVSVRMTSDSPNGPMRLMFANLFGVGEKQMWARAAAMIVPRDIAVVADLSGSMNDDSELRQYTQTLVNVWNIWICLPIEKGNNGVGNGIDPPPLSAPPTNDCPCTSPGNPGGRGDADPATNPDYVGPTWGRMANWGTLIVNQNYNPTSDPGLMYLPYNQSWTSNAALKAWYQQVGYSTAEISALLSSSYDSSGYWKYRTAVALGLARWDSGKSGGLWSTLPADKTMSTKGNGDNKVTSNELAWLVSYPYEDQQSARWTDYIEYTRSTGTWLYGANPNFKCRLGLKTFVNYLLEKHPTAAEVPDFWDTPEQPLYAVKDAVAYCMNLLTDQESNDQVSLEVYATTGRHEANLTTNYAQLTDSLWHMQSGHYDTKTNIGGGISFGINELFSGRARSNAVKVMFLLTDGQANVTEAGTYEDYTGGRQWAVKAAQQAASRGIRIYCVSVGAEADRSLMQEIAELGSGEEFFAAGSIEQYSSQLQDIFHELGTRRPVRLIE